MTAYYNEIDPFAAAWLRELIKAGHIAPGVVDERSIEDVRPEELSGYTQCHFFAGIGVWSYALRQSGWPDDRPVWTGSCPCQPFSSAGKGGGFDDERHLWPSFQWLIEQCKPAILLGEQVASKSTGPWFDLVQADLEALGYTFGCVPFPSAGVGAPHIRDRAYWVGVTSGERLERLRSGYNAEGRQRAAAIRSTAEASEPRGMEHPQHQHERPAGHEQAGAWDAARSGEVGRLADSQLQQRPITKGGGNEAPRWIEEPAEATGLCGDSRPSQANSFWRDVDWLGCRDGKWRPVEPGTFPLANGATNRVGKLRGYGNAINAEAAKVFIKSVMEC